MEYQNSQGPPNTAQFEMLNLKSFGLLCIKFWGIWRTHGKTLADV